MWVKFESGEPERWGRAKQMVVRVGETCYRLRIAAISPDGIGARITFKEVTDPDIAALLRGGEVIASTTDLPALPEGEFYSYKLTGCKVVSTNGEELGLLSEVYPFGHHDVWVISSGTGEILIPAVKQFVESVNLTARLITVKGERSFWDGS